MNAAKQNPRTASQMPRPSKSERILVVKEEETSREIIASMLTRAGYECQEAGDGLEALALLDSSKGFDLLLSGLTMPNLDGIALLERTDAKYPRKRYPVKRVAISGGDDGHEDTGNWSGRLRGEQLRQRISSEQSD